MKVIKLMLLFCTVIASCVLSFTYVYDQGVSDGHTQGSDEMSREWIDGCTKGMTLELNGVTINCYPGART